MNYPGYLIVFFLFCGTISASAQDTAHTYFQIQGTDSILTGTAMQALASKGLFYSYVEAPPKKSGDSTIFQVYPADIAHVNDAEKLSGTPYPTFSTRDQRGSPVKLADLKGKVIFICFWEVTCAPCRAEMDDLNRLDSTYSKAGVSFLGITDNDSSEVADFLKKKRFIFRILPAAFDQVRAAKVQGWPTAFLIDQTGIVRKVWLGLSSSPYEKYAKAIDEVLQ